MEKIKINLFDSLGDHFYQHYGFWGLTPFTKAKKVEWVKPPLMNFEGVSLFTDRHLFADIVDQVKSTYKVALLQESRAIHPWVYENIIPIEDRFDCILTYEQSLLKRSSKYILNPIGTSWVSDRDARIYEKTKSACLIASYKAYTRGHRLRHSAAKLIQVQNYKVDLWGRNSYKTFPEGGIANVLKDYFYAITIENDRNDNYFTEKIIDSFRTGTLPIYWGCENIGDFFNEKGIITFEDEIELVDILENLSIKDYYDRIEYIKENFEIAKRYISMDDNIVDKLKELELM